MKSVKKVKPEEKGDLPRKGAPQGKGESGKKAKKGGPGKRKSTLVSADHVPPEIERLRIRKTLRAFQDHSSFSGHGAGEDEFSKPKQKFMDVVREYSAKADVFASAHVVPKHRICISTAAFLIPVSLVLITWDILAANIFQIPQLTSINAPGVILFINFLALPVSMYGYMMEYLMHENSRHTKLALVCVVCHPILFGIRASMEYIFDGYRNELKLYFEKPEAKTGD